MSDILDAIRQAIQTADKSRYRLWKETGVDQGQLSRLMAGESGLSVDSLERIATALDLEIIIRPRKGAKKNKR